MLADTALFFAMACDVELLKWIGISARPYCAFTARMRVALFPRILGAARPSTQHKLSSMLSSILKSIVSLNNDRHHMLLFFIGESRIFQKRGANPQCRRQPIIWLFFLQNTTWKWKKFDPERSWGSYTWRPLGSSNGNTNFTQYVNLWNLSRSFMAIFSKSMIYWVENDSPREIQDQPLAVW